ncbi:MAG: TonB-dependent receptor [Bacteroides sp.]|nr:TonB-dependent receptor [Bacteroides sp.]
MKNSLSVFLSRLAVALLLSLPLFAFSQNAVIEGYVRDENGNGIPVVSVGVVNLEKPIGTSTSEKGYFSLNVPAGIELELLFSHTSYQPYRQKIKLQDKQKKQLQVNLQASLVQMEEVSVQGERQRNAAYVNLTPLSGQTLPGITGGVEGLVMSLPGVNNNNELSSQYSVRGGNFDENLVYVNGVEIYRPFLTRSGEQEGLSFINPDLVQTLTFSSGGFDARYGDKMSSVLDIRYRQPQQFGGSVGLSFMGGHLHLEGASKNKKFTYLAGLRQKNSQLVLKKLDKSGQYKPSFTDFQLLLAYQIDSRNKIELLGNIAHNRYKFTPKSQQTKFGTSGASKSFWVDFNGFEIDRFTTYFGALTWTNQASADARHSLTASFFNTVERENFDIEGYYRLSETMSDNGGHAVEGDVLGEGHYMDHARNYLNGIITALDYRGWQQTPVAHVQWGFKYQYEDIIDHLDEWHMEDSAGYNLPLAPQNPPGEESPLAPPALQDVYKADHHTVSHRLNAFVQAKFDFNTQDRYVLDAGIRFSYWTLNNEFTWSPRLNFNINPGWKREVHFRLAVGHYAQPPFYKEMRDLYGHLNKKVKAQKSIHAVFATDLYFKMWDRPFKFTAEAYYKYLYDLNPYEIDNVRIRYMARNCGKGYAAGVDLRLDGEFVPGVNSWISLSFMNTRENITYTDAAGVKRHSGWVPRPTNQLVSLNLYVQDYLDFLFRKKNFKIYLNAVYATGLPSGDSKRLEDPSLLKGRKTRLPDYKRVDVGLSFLLKSQERQLSRRNPFAYLKDIWLTLELFNMFQMRNTISYMWIPTVDGTSYAIPNTLTPLQVNLKLDITF